MAYTSRRTGSARSVGRRRTIKYYAVNGGGVIAARSAAGARMDAQMFGVELSGAYGDPSDTPLYDRRVKLDGPAVAKAQPATQAPAPAPAPDPEPKVSKKKQGSAA